jgi:enamine deaminase RidA (YjgF/YER057c/UK114 family)
MKIRDAIVDPQHSPARERVQHQLLQALSRVTQHAHEVGLTPLECIESTCSLVAHIAHTAGIRPQATQMLRAWADDLEKNNAPIALVVKGSA